jgi:hypothetical protein
MRNAVFVERWIILEFISEKILKISHVKENTANESRKNLKAFTI